MSARDDTRHAREVRRRHAEKLMGRPGVVSVGVTLGADGRPAIVVGMESVDAAEVLAIPRTLEDVPIVVRVVGAFEARE